MYKKGEVIYRTSSKSLSDRLQEKIKPYYRKISLKGQVRFKLGEPISLKAEFNN